MHIGSGNMKSKLLLIEDRVFELLKKVADEKRTTVSQLIQTAISEYLDYKDKRLPYNYTKLEKQVLSILRLLLSIVQREKEGLAHFQLSYEQELQLRIGRWWWECKQAVSIACACLDRYFGSKGVSVLYDEDIYHLPHYLEPKRTVTTKEGFIIHFLQNGDDYKVSYQELLDAKKFIEEKIQEGGLFRLVNGES